MGLEVISIGKWKWEIRLSFYGLSCLLVCYYSHLFLLFIGLLVVLLKSFPCFFFLFSFLSFFFVFFTSLHHLKLCLLLLSRFWIITWIDSRYSPAAFFRGLSKVKLSWVSLSQSVLYYCCSEKGKRKEKKKGKTPITLTSFFLPFFPYRAFLCLRAVYTRTVPSSVWYLRCRSVFKKDCYCIQSLDKSLGDSEK